MSLAADVILPVTPAARVGDRSTRTRAIAVAIGLLLGIAPLAWHFARDLYGRGEFAVFLMLVASARVLWIRPIESLRRGSWWIAGPLVAAAWACVAVGSLIYLRWAVAPAAALLAAGVAFRVGGPTLLRWAAPAIALVCIAVPLPSALANPLLLRLREVAVAASGHVFDVLGLPNARSGTVIDIPGRQLLIEEACSGINSLTSVVAFALLYAIVTRAGIARSFAVAIAGAGFALLTNVLRIVAVGVGHAWFGIDLLEPTLHEWLGLATAGLAVGLAVSANQAFCLIRSLRPERDAAASPAADRDASRGGSTSPIAWSLIAVAFAGAGLWSGARMWGGWPGSSLPANAVFVAPRHVGAWSLVTGSAAEAAPHAIQSLNLQNNHWTYRDGDRRAEVSFTYPFAHGVHDCTICYRVTGWTLSDRTIDADARRTTADLARTGPQFARLIFATFDEHGEWQPPDPPPFTDHPLADRIAFERDVAGRTPGYEVQVLGIDGRPIDASTRDALDSLFASIRNELERQMLDQRAGRSGSTP